MKYVRTTIVLPEEDVKMIKILAAVHNLTMSQVIQKSIRNAKTTLDKLEVSKKTKRGSILLKLAGSLNLGGKEPPTRQEMYDRYLREKISSRH